VTLTPTAYRVPKGHRLRLAIADADFPRLWPAATAGTICPTSITLALPLVADDVGSVVELPPPPPLLAPAPMLAVRAEPRWTVSRDHIRDAVTVTFGQTLQAFTPNRQHLLETVTDLTAHVAPDAPAAATMTGVSTATARMATGETVTVRIDLRMTAHLLALRAEVGVDGSTVFNQAWHV
jgi:predicted acyl esterase